MSFDIDYQFKDLNLLEKALTHRSYLNELKDKKLESNERLEYLGDAVLELVTTLYLYLKYPTYSEGKLTALRAKLVQTKTLSLAARRLNVGSCLRLSKGENNSGGKNNPSILADTFEAIIGAIYQDGGFDQAYNFALRNLLMPAEREFSPDQLPRDYKSQLQEIVQSQGLPTPIYKTIKAIGPDHNKTFTISVAINNKKTALGSGKSKQEAEQMAAKNALDTFSKKIAI